MPKKKPQSSIATRRVRKAPASKPAPTPLASSIKPTASRKPAVKTVVRPGRCPCGSTQRTGYQSIVTRELSGNIDGHAYTHIAWKRCRCKDCGQTRVDLFHENRPKPRTKSKPKTKGKRKS